jgi:hypothetical protein
MAKQPASTVRITKTRNGASIRATGKAAQFLFDAMCKAHNLPNPTATEAELKTAPAAPTEGGSS